MENKIRTMRKVLNGLMMLALAVSIWIEGDYKSLIVFMVAFAIGWALTRGKKSEPDEMALQAELFSSYVASAVVLAFLIVMQARDNSRLLANPYFNVLCVWLLVMGGFRLVLKKVWK